MTNEVQVTVTIPAPPEGMEWYEMTSEKKAEQVLKIWRLRPIAPQYVYPKVRRTVAKDIAQHENPTYTKEDWNELRAAMREALEAKGDECDRFYCALNAKRAGEEPAKPEPVCGKHHHDGWEYSHSRGQGCEFIGATLCRRTDLHQDRFHA